jgi:hypothetical protein
MAVPASIQPLVEKYTFHRDAYLRAKGSDYNEAQLRQDFTDPFFHALGWDVNNNKSHSEAYREVLHEEPVRIRGTTYYFDYTFRIGGVRKFIVETKKPSVKIRDDADAALQLRWYAWNAKLPLSILTNFEEWAIYDCTIKPGNGDNAARGRIEYFTYKEIPEKWGYLVSVFSQECILKGSFDKYAASTRGKKGTATVDDDILNEIESWRDSLAKNIAIRNTALSTEELNMVVQRTIDRLLFLRICEDRGIEEYTTIQKLLDGDHVYARLCDLFRLADAKYNSGLFHFEKEPDWDESPDTISLGVTIDDKVLKGIIKRLYYPETPYLFSVIPPEILGHVYEQFLGKVIRLTDGHQAKVEYKPEVKKAGGVFYTPQYIVEYIVKHTVGELTKDKTPRDVAKLRVLDPACGSGSFLIGAFQFLLDWHRDWYIANLVPVFIDKKSVTDPAVLALLPEATPRGKKHLAAVELPIYKAGTSGDATRTRSDWRLTTTEKKRILLNNIFGVDIDTAAVEVTKLSLLLKVLEEENEENINKQLKLFAERALPSLHENIKCGNSLIGTDILTPEMSSEEVKRINPFDWDREFADVMKAGGFDAVIGNPPYLRIQGLQENYESQIPYFIDKYQSAVKRFDLYLLFAEKGFSLLNKQGVLGYICPHKFLNSDFGSGLRKFLIENKSLRFIINFGNHLVFNEAATYTGIFVLSKQQTATFDYFEFSAKDDDPSLMLSKIEPSFFSKYRFEDFNEKAWILGHSDVAGLLNQLTKKYPCLGDTVEEVFQGVITGIDNIYFIRSSGIVTNGVLTGFSERLNSEISIEKGLLRPLLRGDDVGRYQEPEYSYYCIYPYEEVNGKTRILEEIDFKSRFPLGYAYLKQFSKELTELRVRFKTNPKYWYSCHRSREINLFEQQRIVTPEICFGCKMTISPAGIYHNTQVYSILPSKKNQENINYLLGLLNSKIMWWFLSNTGNVLRGGYFRFKTNYLKPFPIRTINFADPVDKARHDRMVALVTQMLDLNKKVQDTKLEHEKTLLSRQIEATDAAIDALVYELYGLTEEEIGIVEGNGK